MADVLGQRSLLGFGVLLAWFVLFHLLVNVWLLCVFTSLLLVISGWFGSQAILQSNTMIHLERFIILEQVPPSAEEEQHLDKEIHNTVKKIIRDFVTSWYSTVSLECQFEMEVEEAMLCLATELKQRARRIDRKELTQKFLNLLGGHLQDYLRAKQLVVENHPTEKNQLWKAYSNITTPHITMNGDMEELNYVRAVVDLLLHVLVPSPHLETRTGRFVVGELITCNVLLSVVAKLSDPDWLNQVLIEILGTSSTAHETRAEESPTSSHPPPSTESEEAPPQQATLAPEMNSEVSPPGTEMEQIDTTDLAVPEPTAHDEADSEEVHVFAEEDEDTQSFLRHYMGGRKLNPFYQENDSDLDSPLASYKPSSTDSLLMMGQQEDLYDGSKEFPTAAESSNEVDLEDVSCPKVLVNSILVECPADRGTSLVQRTEEPYSISILQEQNREGSSFVENPDRNLLLGVEQTGTGIPNELTITSPLQTGSPVSTFSFEPLSSPEGPVVIQNLRITGTITAKEHRGTGSHPYTLYTIKYETSVGCETPGSIQPSSEDVEVIQASGENPLSIQPVAYHMVNRRYSEFLNLQTRLEEKTELRRRIKGVKGPKKLFPDMPFGNMDSDKIEARKGFLETFLKQLCAIPEISTSEEMQEFLALNTDARIAFVKKPFIVSRIDKIVVNAIVDTLKTAFPRSELQSPTEDNEAEVDGGKLCTEKKSRSRLKPSGKNIPFLNGSDIKPTVLFGWDQTNRVFNGMLLEDFQAFITELEKLSIRKMVEMEGSPVLGQEVAYMYPDRREKQSQGHGEMDLAEVALNILCLLMRQQWSWLCTESLQRTVRLLFGTLINRWLDVGVGNLTSLRYWVVYLQVIQEAVWPGGALPSVHQPERNQQQKDSTKLQALHCLMKLLPDLVSDMLGSDKYKLSWQTALDSFQDPLINRHLVYCIFDLLLDFLVPELPEDDFQRNLLQTLSKNPEKLVG
nr:sorting nexin-19 [Nothobranchius furzeri]XP_015807573.2 sorting nexin-19 [Nothobranchius furzeri]XP_015807574.2 sorting nexin-19 [Nothobranchius furzeri]